MPKLCKRCNESSPPLKENNHANPHIQATEGQIATTVLMPGDPLRAKYIAETFLENVVCFNTVRNMFGYTGTYHGEADFRHGIGHGHAVDRNLFV
ncbi:MAG: hypothetical protein MZU97_25225 [Bacillus subtilis]|nr:hypothetical protein [Bacillus subtilis]